MTAYKIKFDGWELEGGGGRMTNENAVDLDGYNCWDFLGTEIPDEFETEEEAWDYIEQQYRGLDSEGVGARFSVVAA